jgi:hypothetical protein
MIDINYLNSNLGSLRPNKHYEDWVEVRDTMFVHTRGKNPGDILTKRRPNEDPELMEYRLSIYEPITKGSINRAIDKLYRIFGAANFSIQVSEELSSYLNAKKFDSQYFYAFIQKYVVRRMIEDPNGYLAWIPYGAGLTDPTQKVDVYPLIIGSDQIRYLDNYTISWVDYDEKSKVSEGGKVVDKGEVIYTLDGEGFYKHEQYGINRDKKYDLSVIYIHNLGFRPAIVLGGDLTDEGYYESYFSAFVPFANEAIRQYSDWQGIMTTSGFPYREEVAETCSAPGCRDGVCYNTEEDEHYPCKVCKGTGRIISRSPYGVFLKEKGGNVLDSNFGNDAMIRFVAPPVDIIKYSGEAWQVLLKKAEEALHLDKIDEAQSGTAKQIDREDSFMVLTKISNNIFDEIIYRSLLIIEKLRNVSSPMDPIIIKPISFSMKTEYDLINEINMLHDRNAPVAFLVEATKDLAKKRFSGNQSIARMVEVLVAYDPIYHLDTKDKHMLMLSGTIRKDDVIKSLFAYKMLVSLTSENGNEYLEKDLSEIFADLDRLIAPVILQYANMPIITI